jgi:diguanylate cyclase (GGDEF)-like protein
VVLVLLPIVVLTFVSGPFAAGARTTAERADSANGQVQEVTTGIAALDAIVAEHSDALTLVQDRASGFTPKQADLMLGTNIVDALRLGEIGTNEAVAELPPSDQVRITSGLNRLRTDVSEGRATFVEVNSTYDAIEQALESASSSSLAVLEKEVLSTPGSINAARSILVIGWSEDLLTAAAQQVSDESSVWFGPPAERIHAALDLAHDDALFAEAGQRIATSGIPAVAAAWLTYSRDPSFLQYNQFLADGERGIPMPFSHGVVHPTPETISFPTLIEAYRAIGTHWRLISDVMDQASTSVHSSMTSLAHRDSEDYELWLLLLATAATVALLVALLMARSISRPLRRLADTAHAVVNGHLDVETIDRGGPRETALVADAFNSLMSNLRLLEAKTQALATCDFDNEVLAVPLPGQLGASLQDSVRVLAGSIQDRHQLQQRLAYEATHDPLTDLFNRAAAISALEQALNRARRTSDATAVLYVDLDNFKQANDLHGHQSGDAILRQVGCRLAAASRSGDLIARLGGDEFVVIAEQVQGLEEAQSLAKRLIEALSEPIQWDSSTLRVGGSVGLTVASGDSVEALDLLARADLALYQAKQRGGGSIGIYDEVLQEQLLERDAVERDLRAELAHGGHGLVLNYQPLVDAGLNLVGIEALVRWNRPGYGMVAPGDFIPVAEATDLIIDLDRWVLAHAVGQIARWTDDPILGGVNVSVNVSGRHLISEQLASHLAEILSSNGVAASSLTIEITETVLLNDLTVAASELEKVRGLGVAVAVDDFGTGYTSLAHLHHLPVDSIKIDRTFITDVQKPNDASLVRMITELARHLGLTTVSEGVETEEQFRALEALGSDFMQGFLIARPMPADSLQAWSKNRLPTPSVPVG